MRSILYAPLLACALLLVFSGCDETEEDNNSSTNNGSNNTTNNAANNGTNNAANNNGNCSEGTGEGLQVDAFLPGALTADVEEVPCTLSNGDETTCYKLTTLGGPVNHEVGPFCPRSVDDTAEVTGIWIESGEVYDADGSFIQNLAEFYGDDQWQLYDPDTGMVRVTETLEACEAAARPDVDPEYNNYCVECALEELGGPVSQEFLIPKFPVARAVNSDIGRAASIGIALNGVNFDPPAPVDAILAAYTIAAFDDCGGHVNPFNGYHYHAATGCSEAVEQCDGHAPLIGYALDSYAIYAMADENGVEPTDLDACRGHEDPIRGYHYHAASAGENMFIGCFHGEVVGTEDDAGPPNNDGPPDGGDVLSCDDAPEGALCCGDGTCGGPETPANCAEDCQ